MQAVGFTLSNNYGTSKAILAKNSSHAADFSKLVDL